MARHGRSPSWKDPYRSQTLRPLNCLLFLLPLLAFFHIGTAVYGSHLLAPRDIGKILRYFGATVAYLPAVVVVVILLAQHVAHKDRLRTHPTVLAGMLAESIFWMLPLIAMAMVTNRAWMHQASAGAPEAASVLERCVSAVGAGIYEEFIFRLFLISILLLILIDVFDLPRDAMTVVAVVVSAVAFSLYHFPGEQLSRLSGLPWYDLVFRTLAGVYLGSVYVFRGLGIAVGAHAMYNIYATLWHA